MTIKTYRHNPLGVPPDYEGGADGYRADAEKTLKRLGDFAAITHLEAEADWLTTDADGLPLPDPKYLGLGVRAYDESQENVVCVQMLLTDRVRDRLNEKALRKTGRVAADAIDRKRLEDAYTPKREWLELKAMLVGAEGVTAEMIARLIFQAGWEAARDLYRGGD